MLKLNNITKSFNKETVLHPFSYETATKSTTVVIGPSGCGKSTLLKLITGLLPADSGEIYLHDVLLEEKSLPGLRRQMGYVIQEGGLFPHLSARSNVVIMAKHLGWEPERIDARIESLASLVQLESAELHRFPTELSGGQRQRVSLMRALMLDPELLVMDEPLGALDPMIRFDLQQQLREIFRRLGKTVFMVTHDLAEAAFFADGLILMREGRVEQQGGIEDLLERPASDFVEQFIRAQRQAPAELEKAAL